MMMWALGLLLVVLVLVLVYVGVRASAQQAEEVDPLQQRLAEYLDANREIESLEQLELEQPFTQRVLIPLARQIGEMAIRFTPRNMVAQAERKLELAGRPYNIDAATFVALQLFASIGLAILMFLLFRISPSPTFRRFSFLGALAIGLMGYVLPRTWLERTIARRQRSILRAMPDALDLLTVCVEAGLGFDAAMRKVSEKWENELAFEFARVLREMQLGKPRREALRDMAERVGVPEMTSFVAAVIQSEQLGVSMAKVLHIQAENMRIKRQQRAREQAQQAPVKMLFPLVFLVMPSLFIVLLGPAVLIVMHSVLGNLLFGG